jgi:intracellular septation protein
MKPQPEHETPAPNVDVSAPQDVWPRLIIELGPLLVFFATNALAGIFAGTAAFMAATVLSLVVAHIRYHKIAIMPIISGIIVLIFGGLTLFLHDETFIKLKPTIVYSMFAVLLAAGLLLKKPLLELLFGSAFTLTEEGWRKLTLRWIGFFIAMAIVNELVWRNFSTNIWVSFKAFGFIPLTILFTLAQMPLLQRHGFPAHGADEGKGGEGRTP